MPTKEKLKLKERLGQILLRKGVISREQLEEAVKIQQEQDQWRLMGRVLVDFGYITQEQLNTALTIQCGRPYLRVVNCRITPEVIKFVPEELAKKYSLIPVDKLGGILTVVMANPLDKSAIEEIENISKCKVQSFFGTPDEVEEAISQHYGK